MEWDMKEDYLKVILVLLIAVIAIQGYYLYDVYRSTNVKHEVPVYVSQRTPLFFDAMGSVDGFFDENENPFIEMERLRRKMESSFRDIEDYFQAIPSFNKFTLESYRVPRFDMKEQKGKYIITMEIPGSLSNAIKTKVENSSLSVSAKISEEKDDNSTNYYRHERHARSYRHEVKLPSDVDADSLQKEYKNGLLIITLDKKKP
jgi:HSP20 family protein